MKNSEQAIVIGAGVAGLASSIRLAVKGFDVVVYEKNSYPGGKLSAFEEAGYRFDAGPSLFTQPELIEELFTLAGEPIEAYFSYQRLPISCHYFYEDGTALKAYSNREEFNLEVQSVLGEKPESLTKFLDQSANMFNSIGSFFLNHSLHKLSTLFNLNWVKALMATKFAYLFKTMHQLHQQHFSNPKTVQLFNRYATYNGSNPYQAPGMLSMIPHLEHNLGSYYPKNGMISITNALYCLAMKKGVQFKFGQQVTQIIHEDNQVRGVVVNNQIIPAQMVISNVDVYFTYLKLLNDPKTATQMLKQERSSSAFIFYWGIKKIFPTLGVHNIFFTKDYEEEFNHLFSQKQAYSDPTVYINITSVAEPGIQAPVGSANWFVMVNAPANIGQDWEAYRPLYRAAILTKLNRLLNTDLASLIEVESYLDPVAIESKTDSFMGSLYGTSSNNKMAAFMRHPNFSKEIKDLYFVGGSVHPGGGIPLCLQSAKIASSLVKDIKH